MGWQERLLDLGGRLTAGEITTDDYRRLSEAILAEADSEVAARTRAAAEEKVAVRIPRSAAWEAPSGEMTQIVGTADETTVVRAVGGKRAAE